MNAKKWHKHTRRAAASTWAISSHTLCFFMLSFFGFFPHFVRVFGALHHSIRKTNVTLFCHFVQHYQIFTNAFHKQGWRCVGESLRRIPRWCIRFWVNQWNLHRLMLSAETSLTLSLFGWILRKLIENRFFCSWAQNRWNFWIIFLWQPHGHFRSFWISMAMYLEFFPLMAGMWESHSFPEKSCFLVWWDQNVNYAFQWTIAK